MWEIRYRFTLRTERERERRERRERLCVDFIKVKGKREKKRDRHPLFYHTDRHTLLHREPKRRPSKRVCNLSIHTEQKTKQKTEKETMAAEVLRPRVASALAQRLQLSFETALANLHIAPLPRKPSQQDYHYVLRQSDGTGARRRTKRARCRLLPSDPTLSLSKQSPCASLLSRTAPPPPALTH